jgi:hypothetical protein
MMRMKDYYFTMNISIFDEESEDHLFSLDMDDFSNGLVEKIATEVENIMKDEGYDV